MTVVVSTPDARRGRGSARGPSPVKAAAIELGIPVSDDIAEVARRGAELGVVVAFGRLIPRGALERTGYVNLHLSLLPRWRGAAPIERAILAGDAETGVSLMALEAGLDTGPLYEQVRVAIDPDETAEELGDRLVALGTERLVERLSVGVDGLGDSTPQEGEPTYASKIAPEERELDFSGGSSACYRVVRIGRAFTSFRGARLIVHRAAPVAGSFGEPGTLAGDVVATADGGLRLLVVQASGARALPFPAFAAGARPTDGERLGHPPGPSRAAVVSAR